MADARDNSRMTQGSIAQELAAVQAAAVAESESGAIDTEAVSGQLEEALFGGGDLPEATIDDADIPESGFWDGESGGADGVRGNVRNEDPADEQDEFEEQLNESVFKYRAGGKDYELNLSDKDALSKKLAMAEGGAKAFSDKARLSREVKSKDAEIARLKEFEEQFRKLDKLKGNDREFVQEFLGKSYEDFEKEAARKYRIREEGTEEEKHSLLQHEEITTLRREMEQDKRLRDLQEKRSVAAEHNAKQARLKTAMEREFFKYELPSSGDEKMDSKRKRAFWTTSYQDVIDAVEGGQKLTNELIAESFEYNNLMLTQTHNVAVETKLKERVVKKKAVDKKQAQLDSQTNYATPSGIPSGEGLNPLSLFKAMKRRK